MLHRILENGHLQVVIPFAYRRISARKRIIVPRGQIDSQEPLALGLARAFRWQQFIDEGTFKNIHELAKAIGRDETAIAKIMRLRMLSPTVIHRILTGDIPRKLTLQTLNHGIPDLWSDQEKLWLEDPAENEGQQPKDQA